MPPILTPLSDTVADTTKVNIILNIKSGPLKSCILMFLLICLSCTNGVFFLSLFFLCRLSTREFRVPDMGRSVEWILNPVRQQLVPP